LFASEAGVTPAAGDRAANRDELRIVKLPHDR
jgi:hypothetical protein